MAKTTWIWILGVAGWLASYAMFGKWMSSGTFVDGWISAFTASTFGTGLLLDLCAVTAMMLALAIFDRQKLGPRWTAAVVASLGLSVSMSLAIYLVGTTRSSNIVRDEPPGD